MIISFNYNVSQYTVGDTAEFKDSDVNGIARANGYVSAGYATVVVAQVEQESIAEPDDWGEEKPINKPKK